MQGGLVSIGIGDGSGNEQLGVMRGMRPRLRYRGRSTRDRATGSGSCLHARVRRRRSVVDPFEDRQRFTVQSARPFHSILSISYVAGGQVPLARWK